MKLFMLFNITIFTIIIIFWFRMSFRQIIFFWCYVLLSSILYGVLFGFYEIIVLLIYASTVSLIIYLIHYIFYLQKMDVKFNEPMYKKGSFRVVLKLIRYTYTRKDKDHNTLLGNTEVLSNKDEMLYKFRKDNNFVYIVSKLGYTIINLESGQIIHRKDLVELPRNYENIFVEYESFKELYFKEDLLINNKK